MTSNIIEITVLYDGAGNPIPYKYIPFESRGIAINAATRSGKSTLLFEFKREFRKKVPNVQIVSIAQDRDEFRQRDEIPFFIIGNNGEIPIDVTLARQIGENTRMQHSNVIVDLNSLLTEKEQDDFASEFLKGLQMDRDESFWEKPCILFLDEVQALCSSGSTKFPKTRDAIVNLAKTCLKKNILPILVSHRMKDFYVNARDEITNHILGYLDNIAQQEFACETLKLPYTAIQKIDEFGKTRGRFFVRGFDITDDAIEVSTKPSKFYEKGKVTIPKLSLEDLQRANALRQSIRIEDNVSVETRLRFCNAEQQARIDELSQTQMTKENIVKMRKEGFKIGYNKAIDDAAETIIESRPKGLKGLVMHGPTVKVETVGWRKNLVIE